MSAAPLVILPRLVVLDTETTGLHPANGDRMVSVGLVELVNGRRDREYHTLINPQRPIPADATAVHGLTDADVADAPLFADIVDSVIAFIGDSPLCAHNAPFDLDFFDLELARLDRPPIDRSRAICTLAAANRLFPGQPASLDALCNRFRIDRSARTRHGALIDARLAAEVYIAMAGGLQHALLTPTAAARPTAAADIPVPPPTIAVRLSVDTIAAHAQLIASLNDPLWSQPCPTASS